MKKSDIVFEVIAPIYSKNLDEAYDTLSSILMEDYGIEFSRESFDAHERLQSELRKTIQNRILQYIENDLNYDICDNVCNFPLKKILKAEVKASLAKQKEEALRELKELADAEAANALEEARLKKEGRTFVVPLKDAKQTEALLRAANIEVKLL